MGESLKNNNKMRNNNEYSFSDGFGAGGGSGAPVIAPTFVSAPASAPYAAPVAPIIGGGIGGGILGGNEGGLLGGLLVGSLLGGNGFGNNRGRDCGGDNDSTSIFGATVLSKLGSIEGAVPLAALSTNNAILESTAAVTNQINQVGLAQLNATAGVKDSVQNAATAILASNASQGEATRALITQLNTDNLNRLLTVADLDRRDERSFARSREIEVNVTQNVNQQQAQLQAQLQQTNQFNQLCGLFNHLAGDIQAVKQGQVIFNSGTMAASGTQSAANTKVA